MNALIVDDEIVVVNALKRRVSWSKYGVEQVFCAQGLSSAQDVFRNERIDLMQCDIEMPGGSGLQLFEWVKGYYPWVECIFVTCHPDFEYIRKALQLGSLDYILKPMDYEELDEILQKAAQRLEKGRIRPVSIRSNQAGISGEDSGDIINNVKIYIDTHIKEHISISDIAEHVHLNSQYLMRLFRKNTSTSILEYITAVRMNTAKILLEKSDDSVSEIAEAVGYENFSYFYRLFKKITGVTPAAYRKSFAENNVDETDE